MYHNLGVNLAAYVQFTSKTSAHVGQNNKLPYRGKFSRGPIFADDRLIVKIKRAKKLDCTVHNGRECTRPRKLNLRKAKDRSSTKISRYTVCLRAYPGHYSTCSCKTKSSIHTCSRAPLTIIRGNPLLLHKSWLTFDCSLEDHSLHHWRSQHSRTLHSQQRQ